MLYHEDFQGYSIKLLKPEDAVVMQILYEQCTEFSLFTYGQPFSPTEARDEFNVLPEGKMIADKYILGLFDPQHKLIGMIESVRHYPDNQTWWLGLMMVSPQHRGQGLGSKFYKTFEHWVSMQDIQQVSLSAIESNELGLKFWKSLGFKVIRKTEPQQSGHKTHVSYVLIRVIEKVA